MPLITAIEPQKKKGRRNVFLDGAYWTGLSDFVIVKHSLKSGKELDEAALRQVLFDEEYEKQMRYAGRLLAGSDRTLKELETRLARRKVPEDVAKAVLAKLEGFGLVGDETYMRRYVESRRGYGYYYYLEKFKEKGIRSAQARPVLDTILTPELEVEYAREFVAARQGKVKGLAGRERDRKLIGMLKTRGFRGPALYSCLKTGAVSDEDG
jgi:regulatory protein